MRNIQRWTIALACMVTTAGGVSADLLINEALSAPASDWDGSGVVDSRDDEWVEILNTGPAVESLDGVYLRDGTGDAYHFGFAGTLAPGEVVVVYGSDAAQWQADNGAGSSGLSLNNGGDHLELLRDDGTPVLLDAVDVPPHAADTERSLGRMVLGGPWILFDGLAPYGGTAEPASTGCEPSPGLLNVCDGIVPVERSSIGALKASF